MRLSKWSSDLQPATRRSRAVVRALLTATASKGVGTVTQLLAFPIAAKALGIEVLGSYVMLSSILAWAELSRLGVGPALTREISTIAAADNNAEEAKLFSTALWMTAGIAALVVGVGAGAIAFHILPIQLLLGRDSNHRDLAALGIATIIVTIGVIASVTEGARAGYLQQDVNNLWNIFGSGTSLAAMLIVAWKWPTLVGMCIAVYGPPAFARLLNMVAFLGRDRRRFLAKLSKFDVTIARRLFGLSGAFFITQLAVIIIFSGPTLLVGWLISAAAATSFALLFRLELMLVGVVVMVTAPIWPAITDAMHAHDLPWITRTVRRLIGATFLYSVVVGGIVAAFGARLVHLWIGQQVSIAGGLSVALGCYFILWLGTHVFYTILLGLGRIWTASLGLLAEASLGILLGILLVPRLEGMGMAIALCIAGAMSLARLAVSARRELQLLGSQGGRPRPFDHVLRAG